MRKPSCPVQSTKRSHAVLLSRVIRATIVRIRCLINSWMASQRLKCSIHPRVTHTNCHRATVALTLSLFFLSMGFVYGCVRACLDSRGCWRLVARLGWVPSRRTDMGAPRESGYYRQTLIWSRPGLPSNFRALTRPLTRLSVNAPKRRDAFSTPAFYRHGELHGLRVRPTGTSRTRLPFRL